MVVSWPCSVFALLRCLSGTAWLGLAWRMARGVAWFRTMSAADEENADVCALVLTTTCMLMPCCLLWSTLIRSGECDRFIALGMYPPRQAYYMQCSTACASFRETRKVQGVAAAILQVNAAKKAAAAALKTQQQQSPDSKLFASSLAASSVPATPAVSLLPVPAPRVVHEPANARRYAGKVVDYDGCQWVRAVLALSLFWAYPSRCLWCAQRMVPRLSLRTRALHCTVASRTGVV